MSKTTIKTIAALSRLVESRFKDDKKTTVLYRGHGAASFGLKPKVGRLAPPPQSTSKAVNEKLIQPRNVGRELATYLLDHGIRYARSDYWTAYYTTFLANERVIVASTETVRIDEYQRLASAHDREAVTLQRRACAPAGGQEIVSGQYWMCP